MAPITKYSNNAFKVDSIVVSQYMYIRCRCVLHIKSPRAKYDTYTVAAGYEATVAVTIHQVKGGRTHVINT